MGFKGVSANQNPVYYHVITKQTKKYPNRVNTLFQNRCKMSEFHKENDK